MEAGSECICDFVFESAVEKDLNDAGFADILVRERYGSIRGESPLDFSSC